MKRLASKTAVVTGATAGIGLAIARKMVDEGAHVYVTGRRLDVLDQAVAELGSGATGVQADVSSPDDVDRLYSRVESDGRRLDIIVANAGGGDNLPLEEVTMEHFDALFNTNVRGALLTVQKALPLLNEGSSVILLSSIAAESGSPGLGVYAAAKAAVRSFARTWANELKSRRIRVNVIAPGAINTPGLTAAASGNDAQVSQMFEMIGSMNPMGRVGEATEIADAALFLAGPESSYTTGSVIYVDGGQAQV